MSPRILTSPHHLCADETGAQIEARGRAKLMKGRQTVPVVLTKCSEWGFLIMINHTTDKIKGNFVVVSVECSRIMSDNRCLWLEVIIGRMDRIGNLSDRGSVGACLQVKIQKRFRAVLIQSLQPHGTQYTSHVITITLPTRERGRPPADCAAPLAALPTRRHTKVKGLHGI